MINLVWNVYRENVNRNCIEIYNIFDHVGFRSECESILEEWYKGMKSKSVDPSDTLDILEKKLAGILQYYFWGKTEYEILCTSHIMPEKCSAAKISIYDQVILNFRAFYYYIISMFLSSDYIAFI